LRFSIPRLSPSNKAIRAFEEVGREGEAKEREDEQGQ